MYPSPAWQKAGGQHGAHGHHNSNSSELRARLGVNGFSADKQDSRPSLSPGHDDFLSPTDAFFSRPSRLAAEMNMRSVRFEKPRRSPRRQDEMQQKVQSRQSLRDLQVTEAPFAKELIDQVITTSEMLYTSAISDLSALRNVLQGSLATTAAEDARVLTLVQANHVKTTTSLSKTRMQDSRNASPSVAGECVTAFKTRIDELEAEIATLWKEWEGAEHAVRKTYAELVGGGINGALGEGVQDTLKQDLEELEGELEEVLDSAWEEARASEKEFSKASNSIMSRLLQQYLLE